MVNRYQFVLYIGSCAHFLRTAKQHTHLSGTNLGKEFFLLCFCICIMNKGNFLGRYTVCNQLGFDVVIDIEGAIVFWCRKIAEQ